MESRHRVKLCLRAANLILVWCLVLANLRAFGQSPGGALANPQHSSGDAATSGYVPNDASARLMQLLHNRPEVAGLLKSFLAQRLRAEGLDVDEQSITNQMLYDRIQTDPLFAKDASHWLAELAAQTSASLQPSSPGDLLSETEAANETAKAGQQPAPLAMASTSAAQDMPEKSAPASAAPSPSVMSGGSAPSASAFSTSAGESAGGISKVKASSVANDDEQTNLTVR